MLVRVLGCLCIATCVSVINTASLQYTVKNLENCVETGHQRHISIHQLLGLWNMIELIEHGQRYKEHRNYLRTSSSDACPVVHFATEEERQVRMLWHDPSGYIQFDFRMTNLNNPGFWMSLGYQTGTLVDSDYEHFSGTVQVMKAVMTHMVLTFCSPQDRHFSIILSRNRSLSNAEIRGVHNQLERVNLPLVAFHRTCRNSGMTVSPSAVLSTMALLLSAIRLLS